MARQRRFLPTLPFENRSVLLFAALTLGAAASQAQGSFSVGPGSGSASATTAKPAAQAAAATTTPPLSAAAQSAFQRADKNRDGQLSREETAALPALAQRFDAIDLDHNGSLSPAEFEQALKP